LLSHFGLCPFCRLLTFAAVFTFFKASILVLAICAAAEKAVYEESNAATKKFLQNVTVSQRKKKKKLKGFKG